MTGESWLVGRNWRLIKLSRKWSNPHQKIFIHRHTSQRLRNWAACSNWEHKFLIHSTITWPQTILYLKKKTVKCVIGWSELNQNQCASNYKHHANLWASLILILYNNNHLVLQLKLGVCSVVKCVLCVLCGSILMSCYTVRFQPYNGRKHWNKILVLE